MVYFEDLVNVHGAMASGLEPSRARLAGHLFPSPRLRLDTRFSTRLSLSTPEIQSLPVPLYSPLPGLKLPIRHPSPCASGPLADFAANT